MIPGKKYSVILADPPWRYSDKSLHRGGAERHYKTMTIKEIVRLNVRDIAADDCLLFLWVPHPMVVRNVHTYVAQCWGFTLKTLAFDWVKTDSHDNDSVGMGHWTRSNSEPCYLGVRGHPKRAAKNVRQVIRSRRQDHSHKPDEARGRIVRLAGDVPRIELFARGPKPEGWDTWGMEAQQ